MSDGGAIVRARSPELLAEIAPARAAEGASTHLAEIAPAHPAEVSATRSSTGAPARAAEGDSTHPAEIAAARSAEASATRDADVDRSRSAELGATRLPEGVLIARAGAGANCSSAGSAIDILFYTSVIAGAVAVALSAAFPPRQADAKESGSAPGPRSADDPRDEVR